MRVNMIIKLDDSPLQRIKPVTFTDTEFRKLRGKILKRGYGLDVDKNMTELNVSSKSLTASEILLLPKRISEDISGIKKLNQGTHRRRL